MPRHPDPPIPPSQPRVQSGPPIDMSNQSSAREGLVGAQQRAPFTDAQFREFMDVQAQQRALDSGHQQQHLRKWAVEQALKLPLERRRGAGSMDGFEYTDVVMLTTDAQAIVDFVTKTAEPADDDRPF